jgi:WhiB family redox-sensing transcriptional regulator
MTTTTRNPTGHQTEEKAGERAMFATEYTEAIADETWRVDARCADTSSALVELFFSEQLDDILRAKAFCQECPVREPCLDAAIARREPWGVWGGELFANGKVLAQKRRRGRPPKVAPPEPVIEELVPLYVEKSA